MATFSAYEIPLQAAPQQFPITLSGTTYTLTIIWNVQSQTWIMDIADVSGTMLAAGNPLLPGVNIIGQIEYLGFPVNAQMIVQSDFDPTEPPTYANLGQPGGSHLYWLVQTS